MRKGSHEVEDLEDVVVTHEQAEIIDTEYSHWGVHVLAQSVCQRGGDPQRQGDACLSWAWQKRQISKIKIYRQNMAYCILRLGVWAMHFNWLCVMTSSSSYLSSAIVFCFGCQRYHANDAGMNRKC